MIARLKGCVDAQGDGTAIIDVAGVGYLVHCSGRTLARLGIGEAVCLLIDTHVREDGIFLYGFLDAAEQAWFRLLTTVQGVGGKAALAILSAVAPAELPAALVGGDRALLTRAPGIGPKLAARIINELKERAQKMAMAPGAAASAPLPAGAAAADAVSALVNLGFRPADALSAVGVAAARLGGAVGVDALIKGGLAELTRPEVVRPEVVRPEVVRPEVSS